jgi:hypothetical protein
MVKSNFRERPEMVKWKTSELIGLKRVEISENPLVAGAYIKLLINVLGGKRGHRRY